VNHIKAFLIKFISNLVLLFIILGAFYNMSFGNVLSIALVLGAVSYLIGDMFILRKTNNVIATFADFGLAFFLIWLMGESVTYGDSLIRAALISAAAVALFEYFFHKYVANQMRKQISERRSITSLRYQTEASEEISYTERKNPNK
jgi:hypothetical protein